MLTVYRVFYNVTLRIRDLQQLDQRLSFRINLLDFSLSIYRYRDTRVSMHASGKKTATIEPVII